MAKLAIIRIRGEVNLSEPEERTLHHLNIWRRNHCTVVEDSPTVRGMISKMNAYITWGEINNETEKELQRIHGEECIVDGKKMLKPFFRLHPPRGGFERKGLKKYFNQKGALGYRGEKINDLIKRMLKPTGEKREAPIKQVKSVQPNNQDKPAKEEKPTQKKKAAQ